MSSAEETGSTCPACHEPWLRAIIATPSVIVAGPCASILAVPLT